MKAPYTQVDAPLPMDENPDPAKGNRRANRALAVVLDTFLDMPDGRISLLAGTMDIPHGASARQETTREAAPQGLAARYDVPCAVRVSLPAQIPSAAPGGEPEFAL